MAKVPQKANNESDESCSLEELSAWSAGRFLAGQHEAAMNVQKRYEALVRSKNPNREVLFFRDEETGELSHEIGLTPEELKELEEQKKKDEEGGKSGKGKGDEK